MAHRNDVIIPNRVRFGSGVAVRAGVQQLFTASGHRHANKLWSSPLRSLSMIYKMSISDIYDILETFNALGGPFDTFLSRDWTDWHTGIGNNMKPTGNLTTHNDAPLMNPNLDPVSNVGDGSTIIFQTYKTYAKGAGASVSERLRHPVASGFTLGVNGTDVTGAFSPSVNESNGEVTVSPGSPDLNASDVITWGGEFNRAVHFAIDDIEQVLNNLEVGSYSSLLLQEARGK